MTRPPPGTRRPRPPRADTDSHVALLILQEGALPVMRRAPPPYPSRQLARCPALVEGAHPAWIVHLRIDRRASVVPTPPVVVISAPPPARSRRSGAGAPARTGPNPRGPNPRGPNPRGVAGPTTQAASAVPANAGRVRVIRDPRPASVPAAVQRRTRHHDRAGPEPPASRTRPEGRGPASTPPSLPHANPVPPTPDRAVAPGGR
jgi:hypothetical protein